MGALTLAVAGASLQLNGGGLLDDLAERAFRFFWQESNASTGFTKDRAANLSSSDSYTWASSASTGFALAACALGAKRGWVDRPSALARAQATLYNLRTKWQQKNGWYYHFVDWKTGQRVGGSEVSSIDTAILLMGAIVAEQSFQDPAVTNHVESMLASVDWAWMLTDGGTKPSSLTFCMGWVPESGFLGSRWDTYCELTGLYILALGQWPQMPAASWLAWTRPNVTYHGYQCLVGGPLFIHQMSHVFMDYSDRRDALGYNYWVEARQATLANRQYCIDNPKGYAAYGPSFWGLSAGDTPDGYKALGAPGNIVDNGTVIPTCAVASALFTPTESIAAAENFRANYPAMWGRYGFSNGINPSRAWVGPDVIGIDLGMMMLGVSNWQDHFANRAEMSHPAVQRGFAKAQLRLVVGKDSRSTQIVN